MGIIHYAANYEEKRQQVLEVELPKYIEDNYKQHGDGDDDDDDGSDDDDDDDGSDDYGFDPGSKIATKTESATERYAPLLKALGNCPSLNLGFHTKVQKDWCFCPFGYKMKIWRETYGLDIPNRFLCSQQGDKNASKRFGPHGLLQHLQNKRNPYHAIVYKYLECLYKDYNGKGYNHKAFYSPNSPKYKEIEEAENHQQKETTKAPPHSQFTDTANPP
jgi:hypothetical protein